MEEHNPLVSICMPAYNADKYIQNALLSVLSQSYKNLEIIVINDGSTDQTAKILSLILDKRVKVYHQKNKGQSAAANQAYHLSSGKLIKFMDADDIISPEFIENQVKLISNKENVIASATWGRFYNNDITSFKIDQNMITEDLSGVDWLVRSWRYGSSMMQCALWLIPRKIIDKAGLWDETLNLINDFEYFTRILLNTQLVLFSKRSVLYYRSGISGSLSDQKSKEAIDSSFRSIDMGTRNLLLIRSDKEAKLACANTWQQLAYSLYPSHKDFLKRAEEKIMLLGGSDIHYATKGLAALCLKLFNWKIIIDLKRITNRL